MLSSKSLRRLVLCSAATALCATAPGAFAHTRFQKPEIKESPLGSEFHSTYNNEVIAHGCADDKGGVSTPVIATSVVFPDGVDSIVSNLNDPNRTPINMTVNDILQNYGSIVGAIQSDDVFKKEKLAEKETDLGNVIGFSQFGGKLPGTIRGLIPFVTSVTLFNPDACVQSVTFETFIADVCKRTKLGEFNDEVVNLWAPAVGSDYDGPGLDGYNSPATLKVVRTSTPLPAGCTNPIDVRITPSKAQINRDAPIKRPNGEQYWPIP
jgi:hypothetical protein